MHSAITIVWFRDDLRLADNPAFYCACESADKVLPVFIFDEKAMGIWRPGGASRWWLEKSLQSLQQQLKGYGSDLLIYKGESLLILNQLIKQLKVGSVYWNRRYTPALIESDKIIKKNIIENGTKVKSFMGNLLIEPWKILNQSGSPYKVFTPFWKRVQKQLDISPPVIYAQTTSVPPLPADRPVSISINELKLYDNRIDWAADFPQFWTPGMATANNTLEKFITHNISNYPDQRDYPFLDSTSHLSARLHFGELSVKQSWLQIWQQIENNGSFSNNTCDDQLSQKTSSAMWAYLRQLVWRDFCHYLLFHFVEMDTKPFNKTFEKFKWRTDKTALEQWQCGKTGYPLVDAGMRQLWQTGWMHNRVRMVCASFLTKHLMLHWRDGANWFWDTLVDADLANNSCGWQWVAGCGADAAPYFRVFNPILQSRKFDASGEYIRTWVPELKDLDVRYIHTPWEADPQVLQNAGIELGRTYPYMIIEHTVARQRALDAYTRLRSFD